ncbi:polyprenyl synthetase family protein [Lacticigenium naphthae]|uniref:polyprenyl synthetase family protein n=1 Tax=Lacticigenium naphthae TaxID=515351 RepID=UPI00042455EC|nr:polyprenyl synthetase family protein [Lacticigenium naphthae]
MEVHPIWNNYPELKKQLENTISVIDTEIFIRNKDIEDAILDMLHSGGKLLRPAFVHLFSTFGDDHSPKRAQHIAAAVELLHTATLIHDDIIDDAEERRQQISIQAKYGKNIAVYAGDYLFTVVFKLLSEYARSFDHLVFNSRGMERILMGELNQLHLRYKEDMTIRNYLTQISGKTAQLFALACYAGSIEGQSSHKFSLNSYYLGNHIGMAFQIIDDILDYTQTPEQLGKPVLEDVRQGVYSAPLIYALQKDKDTILPYLRKKESMTEADVLKVRDLVITAGGVKEAQLLAEKYTEKALQRIASLPETNEKKIIEEITHMMLYRKI